MPSIINSECFTIQPPLDFLDAHPPIRHLSAEVASRYADNELVTDDMLRVGGGFMWEALKLDAEFDAMCAQAGRGIIPIVIESQDSAILSLPWEALYHPQAGFLGLDAKFTLSRRIPGAPQDSSPAESGPLRVLLFTAMSEDQARLDVEEEQAQVQEALMPLIAKGLVRLEMPDDGRFETFQQILKDFEPHLVFLSGHGKYHDQSALDQPSYAEFLFETDGDDGDPIKGEELAQAFGALPVQCVVLSACESGKSASDRLNTGLAHRLAMHGIPHVIGMRESILDPAGTRFNRAFCDAIARRERVDVALQLARQAITQPLKDSKKESGLPGVEEMSRGQWCLPSLVSNDLERPLINWEFEPADFKQARTETFASMSNPANIALLQAIPLNVPLAAEFRIASSSLASITNVAVRLELESGTVGWGESSILQPLTVEDQALAIDSIEASREFLTGMPVTAWRVLSERLLANFPDYPSVRAGIEMAVFDALAKFCGLPLFQFFGGASSDLITDITLPICAAETAGELATKYRKQGFKTLKVKVGQNVDADCERLRAIHRAFAHCALILDANAGFSAQQCIDLVNRLQALGIKPALLEQPVQCDDFDALRRISQETGLPVAADESCCSSQDALRIVAEGAAQVINIKLVKSGVVQALDIAAIAKAAGLDLMIGGMVETRLAMGFSAHFAAGLGGFRWIDLDTPLLLAEDPVDGGYTAHGPRYELDTGELGHGGSLR